MTARERYDALVREDVGAFLRERGFKRERNRFGRRVDGAWEVVDFQASSFGSRDHVSFTVNLGVGFDEVDARFAGSRVPAHSLDMVNVRIGRLLEPARDQWWDVEDRTDVQALGAEIRSALEGCAMPWLAGVSGGELLRSDSVLASTSLRARSVIEARVVR